MDLPSLFSEEDESSEGHAMQAEDSYVDDQRNHVPEPYHHDAQAIKQRALDLPETVEPRITEAEISNAIPHVILDDDFEHDIPPQRSLLSGNTMEFIPLAPDHGRSVAAHPDETAFLLIPAYFTRSGDPIQCEATSSPRSSVPIHNWNSTPASLRSPISTASISSPRQFIPRHLDGCTSSTPADGISCDLLIPISTDEKHPRLKQTAGTLYHHHFRRHLQLLASHNFRRRRSPSYKLNGAFRLWLSRKATSETVSVESKIVVELAARDA